MKFKPISSILFLLAYVSASAGGVSVGAQSGIVIDAESGRILWSKESDAQMYPASTTKIMTALLFLEATKNDDVITAPSDVNTITGASLYLKPFEKVKAEDLAYAILLRSANDACYAAAVHVAGTQPEFIRRMNARAKEIGCKGTNFTNPHGLHEAVHYTTAHDLALIAREAMKNEEFAKIASSEIRSIWRSLNTEDTLIKTHNKFLEKRDDATGIKTGWTAPAGRCFVGSAERNGLTIITVVLKSTDWLEDTEALADWAFASFERKVVFDKGAIVTTKVVEGGSKPHIRAALADEVSAIVTRGENFVWKVVSSEIIAELPLKAGAKIGTVTLADSNGSTKVVAVVSADDIEKNSFSLWAPLGIATLFGIVVGARFFNRKSYRRW